MSEQSVWQWHPLCMMLVDCTASLSTTYSILEVKSPEFTEPSVSEHDFVLWELQNYWNDLYSYSRSLVTADFNTITIQESTIATVCCTALHPAPFRSSSESRTTRSLSFCKRLDVRRQLAASDAACWTSHQLQARRVDVRDSADVNSAVSEPAHLVAHQRTQHSIVIRTTTAHAISTDIIRQTIDQHCCTFDLELTATCSVKPKFHLARYVTSRHVSTRLDTFDMSRRACRARRAVLVPTWRTTNLLVQV